jgi:hypothetical protein
LRSSVGEGGNGVRLYVASRVLQLAVLRSVAHLTYAFVTKTL